jgi:hypothetical protein
MSFPTVALISFEASQFVLLVAIVVYLLLRRRPRRQPEVRPVRGVGVVPRNVIDIHRRRADWAAAEHTVKLPVVKARKPRRRSRRGKAQEVPGLDADAIQIATRLTQSLPAQVGRDQVERNGTWPSADRFLGFLEGTMAEKEITGEVYPPEEPSGDITREAT